MACSSFAAFSRTAQARYVHHSVAADAETVRARADDRYVGDTVLRQLAEADRTYWRLYAAARILEVRQKQYELADAQLKRAKRRVDAGVSPEVEVIRSESGVAQRLEGIITAQTELRRIQRDLKRRINAPGLQIGSPLVIETATLADDRQEVPFHVRLRGAEPVAAYADAKTTLIYTGADRSAAVVDVTHSRNVTIENLRIEAGPGRRFRFGILFHRTDSALTGRGRLLAPSALNVLSCGIAAGQGAFTVGVRLGDAGPQGDLDQNCDHNRLEGLWIEGATDEPGGAQAALREGRTGAGVLVAGSQVQGSFFADLHIKRCSTGIFVLDGQLALFGGELQENGGPLGTGPAGRGGGDVVFRTGLRAGHLLQDVVSRGSTHFLTSFLEDAESVPPTGQSAAWQGDALIAAAMDAEAESKLAKRVSDSEQKVAMLKSMARIKMAELDRSIADREEALSADQKDIVDGLKKIDIDRLTPLETTWLIGAVNNIVLNDRWGGTRDFAAKGVAEDLFREAPGYFEKVKLGKPGEEGTFFKKTDTVAVMLEKIARGPTAAAWFKDKIGLHGTMNALAEARGRLDAKREKRAHVARRHGFALRDDTVQNRFKMGVYAYLIQNSGGTPEQVQKQFERRAENLRSSVRKINDPSAFKEQREKAKWYERAVEDVLGDAKTVNDLRIAPNLKALVDFEIQAAAENEALSVKSAEYDHNKLLDLYQNYTPQAQVAVSGDRTQEEARKDFAAPAWRTKMVDTDPSSSKQERSDTLRPGHIIDLDFFNVVDRSYFDTEVDNIGARHIAVMRDAVNDPRMKELLGADTQKLLRDKMLKVLGFEASKEGMLFGRSFAKMYGRVARRSAGIALKGVMQTPKQMTVAVSTASALGKDVDLLAGSYADAWKAWGNAEGSWQYEMIRDEQIHERAKSLGGLEQIGDTISKKAILDGDEAAITEAAKIIAHKWYVATEKLEYPLKFGDAFSAQAAWFAFYKKKLRQKGVDLKSDDWKYEKDKEAASYANQMVERMQNANTTMAMPDAYHDKGFGKIFLDFFFSFSSFNLNNRKRIARDIDTLKSGANEDKAYAGRDLAAIFVEMVAFNSMAYGLTLGAKGVVDALADKMFGDDDEEEDGRLAFWQEVLLRSTWDYLFTGIPEVAQHPLKRGANKLSDKAVQEITDGAREKVRKDGKDLFYVPNDQGYGVFGAMADEMANFYTGAANPDRAEGQILAILSMMSLLGVSDQTISRPLERELASRLRESKDAGRRRTPKERMEAKLKYRRDRIKRMKERMKDK